MKISEKPTEFFWILCIQFLSTTNINLPFYWQIWSIYILNFYAIYNALFFPLNLTINLTYRRCRDTRISITWFIRCRTVFFCLMSYPVNTDVQIINEISNERVYRLSQPHKKAFSINFIAEHNGRILLLFSQFYTQHRVSLPVYYLIILISTNLYFNQIKFILAPKKKLDNDYHVITIYIIQINNSLAFYVSRKIYLFDYTYNIQNRINNPYSELYLSPILLCWCGQI